MYSFYIWGSLLQVMINEKGCLSIHYLHSNNWKEDSASLWCLDTWWSCLGDIRIPIRIEGAPRWGWRGRVSLPSTFSSDLCHYFSQLREHWSNGVGEALKNLSFYLTSLRGKGSCFLLLGIGGIRLHKSKSRWSCVKKQKEPSFDCRRERRSWERGGRRCYCTKW